MCEVCDAMKNGSTREEAHAELEARIERDIERDGFVVIAVPDGDETYAYTIGMAKKGLPDIFAAGLTVELLGNMVGEVATKHLDLLSKAEELASPRGITFQFANAPGDYPFVLARLNTTEALKHCTQATEYYNSHKLMSAGMVQVYWCDTKGKTLNDADFNMDAAQLQFVIRPANLKLHSTVFPNVENMGTLVDFLKSALGQVVENNDDKPPVVH